jgi:transcription initiation factor TFIIIB Brf1 subunit/transcription initiation factor TFIIB
MDKDFRNEVVFDVRWSRLRKYQKDVLAMRHARLEEEVMRLSSQLGIAPSCVENATQLARRLVGRGYSPQALAAAALIIACRMLKMPRPISDFASYVDDIEKMKRTLRELVALVKTPPRLEYYLSVIVSRANVPPVVAKSAVELLQRNRKALQGRNPWAAAAAALWLNGVDMALLRRFASPSAIRNIALLLK